MAEQFKPKDPNHLFTFFLVKNPKKTGQAGTEKYPDFVLKSNPKAPPGKEWKMNFTITGSDGVYCDASAYMQEDGSLKITGKKNDSKGKGSALPTAGKKFSNADAFLS